MVSTRADNSEEAAVRRGRIDRATSLIGVVAMIALLCPCGPLQADEANYRYDVNGRLVKAEYSSGEFVSFTYDGAGNILTETVWKDTDGDGVPDFDERGPAGNNVGYDGDGNGVPDYQEARVASLPTFEGNAYATVAVPSGQTLAGMKAVANPSPVDTPAGATFPYGFLKFSVNGIAAGSCTTATLYLPQDSRINRYFKYGPTPDRPVSHWYKFMYDGETGAEVFPDTAPARTRVVLHLCDGLRGDDDLLANGVVADTGGPAELLQYRLDVNPSGAGTGSVVSEPPGIDCGTDCTEIYDIGSVVRLAASAAAGSRFAGWAGGGCTGTNDCDVTMNGDRTVTATFNIAHTITVNAGQGGTIVPQGPSLLVDHGTDQAFTIQPDTGYHIVDVVVDGQSRGPITGFTFTNVTADHAISATFAINAYSITVTAGPGGTILPPGPVVMVNYGSDQTFSITPASGYHVAEVLVDGVSEGAITTYTFGNVSANHRLQAWFSAGTGAIDLPQTGQTVMRASGDDGDVKSGLSWPSPRFAAGTGAEADCITDELTGLMWARSPEGVQKNWINALGYSNNLNLCGYADWRLPNVNELESLTQAGQANGAAWLNNQGFSNAQAAGYWTSTAYAMWLTSAWTVDMMDGVVADLDKASGAYVLPVRGTTSMPAKLWKTGQTFLSFAGDDGDVQAGVTWPAPRFELDGSGNCITDNLTGLTWLRSPDNTKRTWQEALAYANTLNLCGLADWRLPNRKEIRSLVDYGEGLLTGSNPATWLNGQGFNNVKTNGYWTSTGYAPSAATSWAVDLSTGRVVDSPTATSWYALPVRSGAYAASDISVSPGVLDFLTVSVGVSSEVKTVSISNNGTSDLAIYAVTKGGTDQAMFDLDPDGCSNHTLKPTDPPCAIGVKFVPTAEGPKEASLLIPSNDPDTPTVEVMLKGEGIGSDVTPAEGTYGTEIDITGNGFGDDKGKVLMGGIALKVLTWADGKIHCLVSKVLSPATYDVIIQPKEKGKAAVTEREAFSVREPEIGTPDPTEGKTGGSITLTGRFFGTKKGKVYLGAKSCKVTSWTMDPATGNGEIVFTVPKGLAPGAQDLKVTNTVGTAIRLGAFTIE
jgi:YD repeat-containing protein